MLLLLLLESSQPPDFKRLPGDLSLTRRWRPDSVIAKEAYAHGVEQSAEQPIKSALFLCGTKRGAWNSKRPSQLRRAPVCDVAAQFEAIVRTSRGPRIGCAPLMSCR